MTTVIRCKICNSTFDMKSFELESGGNIGLYQCPHCKTYYLAYNHSAFKLPRLFRLTSTKSFVMESLADGLPEEQETEGT